jgi:4-amino-4-deoxy-L-arabinose transferase-like glycosyltransferase
VLVAALRRFAGLLLLISAGTVVVSLVIGLAAGSGVSRSVSIGFYLVGCFLLVLGFFAGNRGPVRVKGDPGVPIFGPMLQTRMLRWATSEEAQESLSISVVFVALGFVLILIGIGADTRHSLF